MIVKVDYEFDDLIETNLIRLWGADESVLWVGLDFISLKNAVREFGVSPDFVDLTSGWRCDRLARAISEVNV